MCKDIWHVYLIECENSSFYTGTTNDLKRRLARHQSGSGAKYTKVFGVKKISYFENFSSRAEAMCREVEIKSWSRKKKEELIKLNTKALSLVA